MRARHFVLLFTAVFGCAASHTTYMPLQVGRSWSYTLKTRQSTTRVEMKFSSQDALGFAMAEPGGRVVHWRMEEGMLVLDRDREVVPLFHASPQPGLSWPYDGEDGKKYYVKVRGYEDLSLPAGRFRRCLRIEMEDEARSRYAALHFAPGVGLVRREQHAGQDSILMELESWSR